MNETTHIDITTIDRLLAGRRAFERSIMTKGSQAAELWAELTSLEAFSGQVHPTRRGRVNPQGLCNDTQWILFRCLLAWLGLNGRRVSTVAQYGRETAKVAGRKAARDGWDHLFPTRHQVAERGLLNLASTGLRNRRIHALRALEAGAMELAILSSPQLDGIQGKAQPRTPRAAPDHVVEQALRGAIAAVECRADGAETFPKALRNLAILDVMTYGLRRKEIAAMRWGDLDTSLDGIEIHESKTQRGYRVMRLGQETLAVIEWYRRELSSYLTEKGRQLPDADSPLWLGVKGEAMTPRTISDAGTRLLPGDVRPHHLRGRIATKLAGVLPLQDLAEYLGTDIRSVPYYLKARTLEDLAPMAIAYSGLVALKASMGHGFEVVTTNAESACWLPIEVVTAAA